jgi:autotransporter-associated beta strand protein
LNKLGPGTLTLTGNNSYAGGTSGGGGTVVAGAADIFQTLFVWVRSSIKFMFIAPNGNTFSLHLWRTVRFLAVSPNFRAFPLSARESEAGVHRPPVFPASRRKNGESFNNV